MSFGFSVGDFIAVIKLANKIRKDFVDAPSQFKAISDEVRSLSIVLQDVEVDLSDRELRNEQEAELKQIANGCRNVLNELEHTLNQYEELKFGHGCVSKRVKRVWKRLKWEPEDIRQLRSRISTNTDLLNAFMSRLARDNVAALVRSQEEQGRQTILEWITPIDYALQQNNFLRRRQAGTGQWLLDSAEFKAWVETNKRTLFCPGIPGAGKTILTSIVVKELSARFENDGNISIAYLYCDYRRHHEQNLEDLFASLLKQFVQEQPFIPDSVKTLYDQHKDKRTRPLLDEILGILQTVAKVYSRVFIIVDALDECQISNGCRQRFLSSLFNLQAKCGANLFATSRPVSSIENQFKGKSKLEIHASEEDVRRYLDGHIFRLPGFVTRSLELQEEIKTAIVKAVKGMFLLAKLHLESLTGKSSPKALRATLENLATGSGAYDNAYKHAMERISGQVKDQEELAKQVLLWITCAKRPLATTELQHALGTEVGESWLDEDNLPEIEDMVSVCAGLVTVDEESGIIRLVHYTTQEYFERTQRQWFPNAQITITTTCVTYLSFDTFESGYCQSDEEFKQRLQSNILYDYAAYNWGHHAREASTLCQAVIGFLQKQAQVKASSQALLAKKNDLSNTLHSQNSPRDMTGLHLAAYFGLEAIFQLLLAKAQFDVDSKDTDGRTPLSWAARNGHEGVVKLLLATEKVDVDSKDTYSRTPLSRAAKNRHEGIVKLLLATEKVNIDSKDTNGQTPLSWAAKNGHEGIIKLLLATKKVNIDSKDINGQMLLSWAARNGHEGIIKLLLATEKVNVDLKDTNDWTPLSWAAKNGHEGVVKLLLVIEKVDFNSKDTYSRTLLSWAARDGHKGVVKLLLAIEKVDVDSKDTDGRTPLSRAARDGHKGIVKLLLAIEKVNVDSKDTNGWTVLLLAARNGHESIVKLLLATKKVDVNSKNTNGRTPLSWAAGDGHEGVVKLLLATKKVDVDSKDTYSRTPLWWAAKNGHEGIVKLLLAIEKVDVDSKNTTYSWTPLSWAARDGHEGVIKLLLTTEKVNADLKDTYSQTLLLWAARDGDESVVKLLLAIEKVDVNAKDTNGRTPLSWAARNGHESIVKLLLVIEKVDVNSKDTNGWTVLSLAARNGHESIVKLLLVTEKVNVDSKNTNGRTPLSWAAGDGHEGVVKLLLAIEKVDVNSKDTHSRTPLWWAAKNKHEGVVKLLLATEKVNVNLNNTMYG